MKFEWDTVKEQKNLAKHGYDFATASRVFYDPYRLELFDAIHSIDEDRYLTIGRIEGELVILTVVYTDRGDVIRLISARTANNREKRLYYDRAKRN